MLEKVLSHAAEAIRLIDNGSGTLDEALERTDRDCRRTLEHLLSLVYRYRKSIRRSWNKFCRKPPSPEIASLLDAALTQCRYQSAVAPQSVVNVAVSLARKSRADKFVNAVLRSALREEFILPEKAADILPDAVLKRWRREFSPEKSDEFARLFLQKPEFTFRLCRGAVLPPECTEVPAHGKFRFAVGRAAEILNSPGFARGDYYIQDPATSLALSLAEGVVDENSSLLDLCAAPGGKTLMAAELLSEKAAITAADISAYRQKMSAENFARHRVNAEIIVSEPAKLTGNYQWVIADVPCSNSGVFRRRPDALWRFSEKSLAAVMKLQREIVTQAVRLTAPGGWLLLSSCSIEKDENQALIKAAEGCRLLKEATVYPSENADGAFAALLKKQK